MLLLPQHCGAVAVPVLMPERLVAKMSRQANGSRWSSGRACMISPVGSEVRGDLAVANQGCLGRGL